MRSTRTWVCCVILLLAARGLFAQSFDFKQCGNCKKPLPPTMGVGDTCPHCGVYFAREVSADPEQAAEDDAESDAFALKFLVGIVLAVVVLGGGAFAAANYHLKQQQARWDRYMQSVKEKQPGNKPKKKKKERDPNWI